MLAVALALAASGAWGVGDFLGGLKSRVLPPVSVMAVSQPIGLGLLILAVAIRHTGPPGSEVLWACLSAVFGTSGLFAFYRGLAAGAMSVVAPIAGASAAVPVAVGLATGDHPGSLAVLGFGVAIAGVVLTSREPDRSRARLAAGAGWGLLAMAAFGGYFVPMHAAAQHDFLWAALVFRITSTAIVWSIVLVLRPRLAATRRHLPVLAALGVLDTAGNVLFAAASAHGLVSVVSVLSALYPVVTVLIARIALGERVGRVQEVGVLVTIAGVALISTG